MVTLPGKDQGADFFHQLTEGPDMFVSPTSKWVWILINRLDIELGIIPNAHCVLDFSVPPSQAIPEQFTSLDLPERWGTKKQPDLPSYPHQRRRIAFGFTQMC